MAATTTDTLDFEDGELELYPFDGLLDLPHMPDESPIESGTQYFDEHAKGTQYFDEHEEPVNFFADQPVDGECLSPACKTADSPAWSSCSEDGDADKEEEDPLELSRDLQEMEAQLAPPPLLPPSPVLLWQARAPPTPDLPLPQNLHGTRIVHVIRNAIANDNAHQLQITLAMRPELLHYKTPSKRKNLAHLAVAAKSVDVVRFLYSMEPNLFYQIDSKCSFPKDESANDLVCTPFRCVVCLPDTVHAVHAPGVVEAGLQDALQAEAPPTPSQAARGAQVSWQGPKDTAQKNHAPAGRGPNDPHCAGPVAGARLAPA